MDLLIPAYARRQLGDDLDLEAVELSNNKLKLAWQILKDETCQECGQPVWICHNSDRYIGFEVDYTTCFATQAIEEHKKLNNGEGKPGRNYYVKPFMYGDVPYPTREAYYEALNRREATASDESD